MVVRGSRTCLSAGDCVQLATEASTQQQKWPTKYQVVVGAPVANQNARPQGATDVLVAVPARTTDASVRQNESAVQTTVEGSFSEYQDVNSEVREVQDSETGRANREDEEVENILPQLMGSDLDLISEIDSESGTEACKRKSESVDEKVEVAEVKKRKVERQKDEERYQAVGSAVQESLVEINGLVDTIQRQTQSTIRAKKVAEKSEKALMEIMFMLDKVVVAFTEFKNIIQERAADRQKREESWLDREKRLAEDLLNG